MSQIKKSLHVLLFYIFIILIFILSTILGNQAVSTVSEMVPVQRKHHIVIDAGHGGEDGGAVSCSGRNESTFNLQIALRLDDLLHLLGYDTVMIRKTDTAVYTAGDSIAQKKVSDLKHRVHIVENTKNAILLSIHQNTFPEGKYHGAQVFYASSVGSEELAKYMQANFIASINPGSSRQEKKGNGIYLLERIHAPGVLVECGFLSNYQEEALLRTAEYQKKICCIIAASVGSFLAST